MATNETMPNPSSTRPTAVKRNPIRPSQINFSADFEADDEAPRLFAKNCFHAESIGKARPHVNQKTIKNPDFKRPAFSRSFRLIFKHSGGTIESPSWIFLTDNQEDTDVSFHHPSGKMQT